MAALLGDIGRQSLGGAANASVQPRRLDLQGGTKYGEAGHQRQPPANAHNMLAAGHLSRWRLRTGCVCDFVLRLFDPMFKGRPRCDNRKELRSERSWPTMHAQLKSAQQLEASTSDIGELGFVVRHLPADSVMFIVVHERLLRALVRLHDRAVQRRLGQRLVSRRHRRRPGPIADLNELLAQDTGYQESLLPLPEYPTLQGIPAPGLGARIPHHAVHSGPRLCGRVHPAMQCIPLWQLWGGPRCGCARTHTHTLLRCKADHDARLGCQGRAKRAACIKLEKTSGGCPKGCLGRGTHRPSAVPRHLRLGRLRPRTSASGGNLRRAGAACQRGSPARESAQDGTPSVSAAHAEPPSKGPNPPMAVN